MKRQKRYTTNQLDEPDYREEHHNNSVLQGRSANFMPMQKIQQQRKFENSLEAQVRDGDTLQALALRFHCTVADIKRLNKIDKDNEIFARKIVKIPITVHSVLLESLPAVHKSGNNSPKHHPLDGVDSTIARNPLEVNVLSEKLLVASVNSAVTTTANSINNIILNSKVTATETPYSDTPEDLLDPNDITAHSTPLLSGFLDESIPQPTPIAGLSVRAFDWSGSDCDMSWICLFVVILAVCFAIPLIYVFYVAEHPERFHHTAI